MDSSDKKVSVAVRIRPRLPTGVGSRVQQEEYRHPDCVIVQDECTLRLQEQKQDENCKSSTFTFDYVFDMDCPQGDLYEESVQELVDASLGVCPCASLFSTQLINREERGLPRGGTPRPALPNYCT
ncbi:kinesin [Diplonema papillatum]|nr:kinesin [Diplonema papillatum]